MCFIYVAMHVFLLRDISEINRLYISMNLIEKK